MTGPAHFCFSVLLPAKTSSHPQCAPPKSFVMRILPLTPTRSGICERNPRKSVKNEDFTKMEGGRGRPLSDIAQSHRNHDRERINWRGDKSTTLPAPLRVTRQPDDSASASTSSADEGRTDCGLVFTLTHSRTPSRFHCMTADPC